MNINVVVITGNLTRTPELRSTPGGTQVTDITIACNEYWTDQSGERQERAHFVDVTVWGRMAENVCRHLGKGDLLGVRGRLRQDKWTDKETGKNRSKLVVTAEDLQFGPKRGANPGSNEAADNEAAQREHNRKQFMKD